MESPINCCPILVLSPDVLYYIFLKIKDWHKIIAGVNRMWRSLILTINHGKIPVPNITIIVYSVPLLQWAQSYGLKLQAKICNAVAIVGNLEVLAYANNNGYSWNIITYYNAAEYGHLHILQYLYSSQNSDKFKNGCNWDKSIWKMAIYGIKKHNSLQKVINILEYLNQEGCPRDDTICNVAAEVGNLILLKLLKQYGCLSGGDIYNYAARGGNLEIIKYIRNLQMSTPYRYFWNGETCAQSALCGNLQILQYFHENGCPWDSKTCEYAAYNGNLNCLQYAHENGCPWNGLTYVRAIMGNHIKCLEYAYENGCQWHYKSYRIAIELRNMKIIKWLHEHGCPWDEDICFNAVYYEYLEILHENGCSWNYKECLDEAVESLKEAELAEAANSEAILKYLHEHNKCYQKHIE